MKVLKEALKSMNEEMEKVKADHTKLQGENDKLSKDYKTKE